jgi:Leucine-rich repeat (LRR) protein
LTSLILSSCGLNGTFPEKIFQIPTLETLDLSFNFDLQGSLPEFPLNGSLRMLVLSNTTFSGTLPNSIGNLKMLSLIDLSYCNFNGSIPKSMTSLAQLLYLDMSSNYFVGSIPSFNMGKNLTTIDLSNNNLSGQITSTRWEELLNLEVLNLRNNSLEGSIPMSLFSLPSLQKLTLSNNRFSGQLNELLNVSSCLLETLDLSYNNLEGPIPMSLFEIQSLRSLSLSNNSLGLASSKLKTYPHFLINQSTLSSIDLSNNKIHGKIPNWIWKLPYLDSLNLSYNHLETLDLSLLNMSSLSYLDLHSNKLQGQLSVFPEYARHLDFSRNNFSFVIPANIGNFLTNTYFFSLSSNKFNGSIPSSICDATKLIVLDLSDNLLSDTIPQCLFKMIMAPLASTLRLVVLNLCRNNLIGTIPNVFPSNCGLQTLNLNGNQIEGKLPKFLAQCTSLEVLDLGNNHIEDAFPCYLKNISALHVLILRSNKFYGPIVCRGPNASWPMLQIVDLAANNFTGKLQIKDFSNWKAMTDDIIEVKPMHNHLHFDFGRHVPNSAPNPQIFAQTPLPLPPPSTYDSVERRVDIYYQDVITITMKGLDVKIVKILNIFTSLDFSCNNFEGSIPGEIGELKSLYILNLSHNAFRGQIPPSLGKLSELESLDLSSNELTGEIPIQLADGLIFLSVLNLSFNQLVGQIPQIKQFTTFPRTSYEGNRGLCGIPLKEKCTREKLGSSPPIFEETHSNSTNAIDWNFLSAELGFIFGFGIVIGPLMFWKRWRICYYKHADDIFFKMFPQLYIRIENRQRRAHKNQGRRH